MGGMQPLQAFSLPRTLEEASFKLTENVFEFIGNYLILALVCICCVLCVPSAPAPAVCTFWLTRTSTRQVQAPCGAPRHLGCLCRMGVAAAAAAPCQCARGGRHYSWGNSLALGAQTRRQAVCRQPGCWGGTQGVAGGWEGRHAGGWGRCRGGGLSRRRPEPGAAAEAVVGHHLCVPGLCMCLMRWTRSLTPLDTQSHGLCSCSRRWCPRSRWAP